jgi:hypothetical protein
MNPASFQFLTLLKGEYCALDKAGAESLCVDFAFGWLCVRAECPERPRSIAHLDSGK